MPAAAAIAAAGVLALAGCVSTVSYPDRDEMVIEAERQRILDLTWQNLGLENVARPTPALIELSDGESWTDHYFSCAANAVGDEGLGLGFGGDVGYDFASGTGADYDDPTRLALYACVAALPLDDFVLSFTYSPAQIEYLYDYFQGVLIPCIETHGLTVTGIPTREQFAEYGGQWDPYANATSDDLLLLQVQDECGISPGQQAFLDGMPPPGQ